MKKRVLGLMLAVTIVFTAMPMLFCEANAAEDWKSWAQADSRWASIKLGNSSDTMAQSGCLVTSVAKIMVQSGFADSSSFNPGTLVSWLNNNNTYPDYSFTAGGALYWAKPTKMISGFSLVNHQYGYVNKVTGSSSTCESRIMDLIKSNYHVILAVKSYGHYVAVDNAKSLKTGRVYIMDSLSDSQNVDILLVERYSTISDIALYSGWTDDALAGLRCNHEYNNVGWCSNCQTEYDWQSTFVADEAGLYEVNKSGGLYLRLDKPYDASTNKSSLIKKGTQVQVLGSVTNHYKTDGVYHKWYKVSYNGDVGYAYHTHLTKIQHTCDKGTYKFKEAVHPHRSCYECSICGKVWAVDGTTNYYDACLECNRPGKPVLTNLAGKSYKENEAVTFSWAATSNTTHYNLYIQHKNAAGQWEKYDQLFYVSSGMTLMLPANEYRCYIQSYNSNYWAADGSDWLYTEGDFTYFSVVKAGCSHSYSSSVTTAATCVKNGVRTYTCSKCGHSYTETIAATGVHSYGSWTTTQAATCTTTGTRKKTCSSCGDVQTLSIPATGHSYSSWVTTTVAGCTTTGTQKRTCSSCGNVQTQSIAATGHSYADGICTVCGTEEIVDSGTCGDNLTWRLLSRGKLVISGAGAMSDYCFSDNLPWNNYLSFINNVAIEDNVTSIGESAFEGCESLESITIPNSVTSIGKWAFEGCESLENVTIPDSVTSIGECTFAYCKNLESITIPDGVTSIGAITFEGCESLESITIPDSVTSIGEKAFAYCENLESITIPDSVTSIGEKAFTYCENLKCITIPDSISSIGVRTFEGCESLESITIPDSVTSIGEWAFAGCKSLERIVIPASVTSIGPFAFSDCTSLTTAGPIGGDYDYQFGWTSEIPEFAFRNCMYLESITIPDSITSIGEMAFELCTSLESITIPNSVTSIGEWAFASCKSLESISIPDSVTSIGEYTFAYCENLESISIPDSVTSIGKMAFERCTSLQNVYYTGTKTQWEAVVIGSSNDALLNATVHFVENLLGDADGSGEVTTDDAVYLLLSVMFGAEDYPVPAGTILDFDGNRTVDTDDAVYLLLHVMFGAEDYPLA